MINPMETIWKKQDKKLFPTRKTCCAHKITKLFTGLFTGIFNFGCLIVSETENG